MDDEEYAYQIELEMERRLRRAQKKQEEAKQPKVENEPPLSPFSVGSAVKNATPESLRRPLSSVMNVARQPVELGALAFDAARSPFTAIDRAMGADQPLLEKFSYMSDAGDAAFGKPNVLEKIIGSGVIGGLAGKATQAVGPVRGALAGSAGYLGAEAGDVVGGAAGSAVSEKFGTNKQTTESIGKAIGALTGGFVFGVPTMLPQINTANRLAVASLKGIPRSERIAMSGLQDEMTQAGFHSMPSQLSEFPTPGLVELQNRVLGANVGRGTLEEKISAILARGRSFAGQTARALGGETDDSLARANTVQDVVERVVDLPRTRAREAARPFYKMLELDRPELPIDVRFDVSSKLAAIGEKLGILPGSGAGSAVSKAQSVITQPSVILQKTGKPFELAEKDVYSLNQYMKQLREAVMARTKLASSSAEAVEALGYKAVLDDVDKVLKRESPVLRAGSQAYHRVRQAGQDEVRSTGIPAAKPMNLSPGPLTPAAKWEQFNTIIEQGSPDDVRRAAALLRGRDNDAFRDIVKNWLKQAHDKTILPGSGKMSEPKAFAEQLLANPNLDAILEEAAKGLKGVDPTEFVVSFRKSMRILQAAGRPVNSSSAMDVSKVIGNDPAALAGRFGVVHELGRKAMLASKYFEWAQNRQWQKLYDVLDSPDSMRKLSEMADMAEMNPRSAALLSSVLGMSVAVE